MKAILICPAERKNVASLAEYSPLSNAPILGAPLIEYWLEHLVELKATRVLVSASDRPERVRELTGIGERWGLRIDVIPESRELTAEEARAKYRLPSDPDWLPAPHDAGVMDHLPNHPELPLFDRYEGWMAALRALMPEAARFNRIGLHQIRPGVWVGLHTRIAPGATLEAPCWIGDDAQIEAGAVIGPAAVVESRAFIDRGVEISDSLIGPDTYVGEAAIVRDSIAFHNTLTDWKLDSPVKIADNFLLCSLTDDQSGFAPARWFGRATAALAMLATVPLVLPFLIKSWLTGRPALRPRLAAADGDSIGYYELTGSGGALRRWPQLWNVVRGEFAWIGNRPLDPAQAAGMRTDFERLWLAAPVGIFSLADSRGCPEHPGVESHAHSAYYATQAGWRLDAVVFFLALFRLFLSAPGAKIRRTLFQFPRPEVGGVKPAWTCKLTDKTAP